MTQNSPERDVPEPSRPSNAVPDLILGSPADAVNGEKIMERLVNLFDLHLYLPDGAAVILALWAIHTHAIDTAEHSPLLHFRSPEPGCGKTTALKVLEAVVRDPELTADASISSLFRLLQLRRPTLLLDEGDMWIPGNRELTKLLNSGHTRAGNYWRAERRAEGPFDPTKYSTWGAKAIAAIGTVLPPQTLDRSIVLVLHKRPDGAPPPLFTAEKAGMVREVLREEIGRWVAENDAALRGPAPAMPAGFVNRKGDNWRPLFKIADCISGDCGVEARRIAVALTAGHSESRTLPQVMLADMKTYFDEHNVSHCPTVPFIDWLERREDRPWADFRFGKPITPRGVSDLMEVYGIRPRRYRIGDELFRGYPLDVALQQVFRTYVVDLPEHVEQLEHNPDVPHVPNVPVNTKRRSGTIDLRTGKVNS